MNLRVLIPVRPFEDGKRRLSTRLSPLQRQVLNARLCRHLFDVVLAVVPAGDCIVVSRSPEVLALAESHGMQALAEDPPGGLNPALEQAAALAAAQGADAVLSLACDLPLLSPDDVRALIARAAPGRVVLGSDQACSGTNALLMSPPGAIAYRYGADSRRLHHEAALAAGLGFEAIHRPGIATDIDTPADIDALPDEAARLLPGRGCRESA